MSTCKFTRYLNLLNATLCLGFAYAFPVANAQDASPTPSAINNYQYQGESTFNTNNLLDPKIKAAQANNTYHLLNAQEQNNNAGTNSALTLSDRLAVGQARAQEMVNLLKDAEMQQALKKVTNNGKDIVQANPELKNPATMVAGAVALWYGRTVKLIKGEEVTVYSKVTARDRSGEFSMQSPLLDGKLQFDPGNGASLSLNRKISSIDSNAQIGYNPKYQAFTSSFSHNIAPHLDLSFGSAMLPAYNNQVDQNAKIEYRIDF